MVSNKSDNRMNNVDVEHMSIAHNNAPSTLIRVKNIAPVFLCSVFDQLKFHKQFFPSTVFIHNLVIMFKFSYKSDRI